MRKGFSFYRSYYEQLQHLDNDQIANLVMTLCKVQFIELHIDDVKFEDKMENLAWSGIKHSLKKTMDGYCAKMNINYDAAIDRALDKVLDEELRNKEKSKMKNKDNEEGKVEERLSSSSLNNIRKEEVDAFGEW